MLSSTRAVRIATPLLIILYMGYWIWYRFNEVLISPSQFLFANSGDGLKNYYNFIWYLRYDEGLRFTGMNYPYGEHLLYTDSHPLWAYLLNLVDDHLFHIYHFDVGFINLMMIVSFFITPLILYLILREFRLPAIYAAATAIFITMLHPQIDRMYGHYALSYSFWIPLMWLLLIRVVRSHGLQWRWLFLLCGSGLVAGLTHIYFAAIYTVFILTLVSVYILVLRGKFTQYRSLVICLLAAAFVPVLFITLITWVTDSYAGQRPGNPYGFFVYHANIWSVFLPSWSSIRIFIEQLWSIDYEWEGRAFIGIVPLLFSLWLLGYSVFKGKRIFHGILEEQTPVKYMLAAVMVLLFSMCIPFQWGLQFLVDWIPNLKQFRSLGRFAWVFYYIWGVSAAYYLYAGMEYLKTNNLSAVAYSFTGVALLIWFFDSHAHFLASTSRDLYPNTLFHQENVPDLKEEYQAIIYQPLNHTAADKLLFQNPDHAQQVAMSVAYVQGIPLVPSTMPRVPLDQSLSSIQLYGDAAVRKVRLQDMTDAPLLLIAGKETHIPDHWQKDLSFIDDRNNMNFYNLRTAAFESEAVADEQKINILEIDSESLEKSLRQRSCPYEFFSFVSGEDEGPAFRGGSSWFLAKGEAEVASWRIPAGNDIRMVYVSGWLYIDESYSGMPWVKVVVEGMDQVYNYNIETRSVANIRGRWVYFEERLPDVRPGSLISVRAGGRQVRIDELLLLGKCGD